MTKVILINKNRRVVFNSFTECAENTKITLKQLNIAINKGTSVYDQFGNKWYVDEVVEQFE